MKNKTTKHNSYLLFLTLLFLHFGTTVLNAEIPFNLMEGSLEIRVGTGADFTSDKPFLEIDFKDSFLPQFYISFEDLKWKKRYKEKDVELLIDTKWIKIGGNQRILEISPTQISLSEKQKGKIFVEVLNNGWVDLEIEMRIHYKKTNKKTIKKAYKIRRKIMVTGVGKKSIAELSVEPTPRSKPILNSTGKRSNPSNIPLVPKILGVYPTIIYPNNPTYNTLTPIKQKPIINIHPVLKNKISSIHKDTIEKNEPNEICFSTSNQLNASIEFSNGLLMIEVTSGKIPVLIEIVNDQKLSVYKDKIFDLGNYSFNIENLKHSNGAYNVFIKDIRKTKTIEGVFEIDYTNIHFSNTFNWNTHLILLAITLCIFSILILRINTLFPAIRLEEIPHQIKSFFYWNT